MEKILLSDWKKIPNLVSIFRVIFIPWVVVLFNNHLSNKWFIIFLIILFSLLDNLDGYLARKLSQITEFGKIIDPLVDKLFVITIAICLYYYKLLPLWFILVVILRDFLIMLGGLLFLKRIRGVPSSDFIGKFTVGAIGVVFLVSLLNFQALGKLFDLILIFCSVLILISLINYAHKQLKKVL